MAKTDNREVTVCRNDLCCTVAGLMTGFDDGVRSNVQ